MKGFLADSSFRQLKQYFFHTLYQTILCMRILYEILELLVLIIARYWISGEFRQYAVKAILCTVAKYQNFICKRISCENWKVLWSQIKDRECVEFQANQDDSVNRHLNFNSILFFSKFSRPIDKWMSFEKLVDVVLTPPFKIRSFLDSYFRQNVMLFYERLSCVIWVVLWGLVSRNRGSTCHL